MENNFHFKKKYGQNFLKNHNIVTKISKIAPITKQDMVIEVGPGSGVLTDQLAKASKMVLCYEIDTNLEDILAINLKEYDNINIIYSDFLIRNLSEDIKKYDYNKLYFVSNVPYYITTPILFKLINENIIFEKIVMMVQKEVGERFCATCGKKEYGALSVLLNYYFLIKKEFIVSRKEFYPIPNVDSIVISFTTKNEKEKLKSKDFFHKLVHDSFQFKRKNIRNNLKNYNLKIVEKVLKKHHYDLTVRSENLDYKIFVELANELYE